MNAEAPEADLIIEPAIVRFTDGLPDAEFDRVDFLPDGRLKATLTVNIVADGRPIGASTEIAYFAPGAWLSVRPQPRGALLAELAAQPPRIIASGIPQSAAAHHISNWLPLNRIQSISPELDSAPDLFNTVFRAYDRFGDMTDATYENLRFRWVWPPNHDRPLEDRAAQRSVADQP